MSAIDPIRKQITVAAPQATAFEVFTAEMKSWWNPDYSIGGEPVADIVVEPEAGGRWFELGQQGGECDWGRVVAWEPPHRVVLTWQISPEWQYDPDLSTELDIRFTDQGPATTLVELEHRNLDGYGDAAAMIRGIFDAPDGWGGLLQRFADAAPRT